jgi:predicted transcriptional regulator
MGQLRGCLVTSVRFEYRGHEQYEMLARATGRTRNDLMVEALRGVAERQLREIALVQEGLAQSRAGLGIPIEDIVAQRKAEGLLPAGFVLGPGRR